MLQIIIPPKELYDEERDLFSSTKEYVLQLEHSLVSLSKWESKWCKPFLSRDKRTFEESADYVRCMTITQNVDPEIYNYLSNQNMKEINDYIESPMTATTFAKNDKRIFNREIITAEIIYYWMIALNVPFECQKWHLNRLLTLIEVCNIKNKPSKKMSRKEIYAQNHALNAARRLNRNSAG